MEKATYKEYLKQKYLVEKKTDQEIAIEKGVTRTAIVKARQYYGIPTRKNTGLEGEVNVIKALKNEGFSVIDMNQMTKTFPFDMLVNNYIRIEVKSSTSTEDKTGYSKFTFTFSEKMENQNIETSYRIKLRNGRTRKLYRKTCDFLILVCMSTKEANQFYIIPSDDIPDTQVRIGIPTYPILENKYDKYKNNWDLLRR